MARRDNTTSFSISRYILFFILCLIAIVAGIWFLTATTRNMYRNPRDVATVDIESVTVTPAPSVTQ